MLLALLLSGMWLWVYLSVDRLLLTNTIFDKVCNSDKTQAKFSESSGDNCITFDYFSIKVSVGF